MSVLQKNPVSYRTGAYVGTSIAELVITGVINFRINKDNLSIEAFTDIAETVFVSGQT